MAGWSGRDWAGRPQEPALQADREGKQVLGELRASRQAAIEAIWTGFSRDELAAFSGFAIKLSDRIERYSRRKMARRVAAVR